MMKTFFILLFTGIVFVPAKIDKLSFYRAFESDSQKNMTDKLLSLKKAAPSSLRDAYVGALTMKISQFEKTPKEKAETFKVGRDMLEAEIEKHPENGEYRFLRLAIQENIPKVLKYNKDIDTDATMIIATFKSLDPSVRTVIRNYAKQSEHLDSSKLK